MTVDIKTIPTIAGKPGKAERNWFQRWSTRAIYLGVFIGICQYLNSINDRFYHFSPEVLNECVQSSLKYSAASPDGGNSSLIIDTLIGKLADAYPDAGFNTDWRVKEDWVFNNAAGAMGAMYIIHASVTEYLIIFGSAVGTEGHTGRHTADDYFHILSGQQSVYEPGDLVRTIYNPGDVNLMSRGVARHYLMVPETWALEYARGWIPLMLPMGYADTFTSTLDFPTIWRTTWLTGKDIVLNLWRGKV